MTKKLVPKEAGDQIESLASLFESLPLGHSSYQLRNFVVGPFLTVDRQYKQCLLELYTRYGPFKEMEFDYKDTQLDIASLSVDLEEFGLDNSPRDQLRVERIKNDIARHEHKADTMRKRAAELVREIIALTELEAELRPQRSHDNFEAADKEYWEKMEDQGREEQEQWMKKALDGIEDEIGSIEDIAPVPVK